MTHDTEYFVCHTQFWYFPKVDELIRLTGSYKFAVSREIVWLHIFDPKFLVDIIPGCESLDYIWEGEYTGKIRLGLAGISRSYNTRNLILSQIPLATADMMVRSTVNSV